MEVESSSVVDAFDVIVSGVTVGVIVSGVTVDVDDDLGISDDIVEDDAGTVVIGVSDTVAVNVVDVIVVVGGGELQSCIFPQIGFSVVDGVVVGVSGCLVVVVVVVDVIVVVVSGVAIGVVVVVVVDVIVVVLGVAIGVVVGVVAVVDVGFSVVGLEGQ